MCHRLNKGCPGEGRGRLMGLGTGLRAEGAGAPGYGLRGPPKAALSALQAAAAVMPPLAWARPATPEAGAEGLAEEEAGGLAAEEGGEVLAAGLVAAVAPACGSRGACRTRPG